MKLYILVPALLFLTACSQISTNPDINQTINSNKYFNLEKERQGFIDIDFLDTFNKGYPEDVPLEKAVTDFNNNLSSKACGVEQPKLTVEEINASLAAVRPDGASIKKDFYKLLQQIADSKTLPKRTAVNYLRSERVDKGKVLAIWQIHLIFDLDKCPQDRVDIPPCTNRIHIIRRQYIKVIPEGVKDICEYGDVESDSQQ